ncbi:hypothetical protein ECP03048163_5064 [Escherichia coli P0304816.3]|nr:hypothetical protein ECP03048163_5064 [Escherichia coli P0304816.3]
MNYAGHEKLRADVAEVANTMCDLRARLNDMEHGPFGIDDVYQQFTCVNPAIQPCAPSALTLADMFPPHGFHMV